MSCMRMTTAWLSSVSTSQCMREGHLAEEPARTDIYPLRRGHCLLIPKQHYARLADLPSELGEAMGRALPRITRAINEGNSQAIDPRNEVERRLMRCP